MLKLFSSEVKDNDPMMVAFEIVIMHKIQAPRMKLDLPLAAFVNSLYPTHSNYLDSLQASDMFNDLTFDILVERLQTESVFKEIVPMAGVRPPTYERFYRHT